MLADALDCLRCPHCANALRAADAGALVCAQGHTFDVARQGYVSLLRGGDRAHTADTAAMVRARTSFLAAGHYLPVADALRDVLGGALRAAGAPPGCILDCGAGTGYVLAHVLDAAPGRAGVALDVAKPALQRAARAHPRIAAVACDVWEPLPVHSAAAAAVLSVFAPRNAAEMRRVIAPGGLLVVVTPLGGHAGELVDALGLLTVDVRKEERLDAQLGEDFERLGRSTVTWRLSLSHEDVADYVRMGPHARHVDHDALPARIAALPDPLEVAGAVTVATYRPR